MGPYGKQKIRRGCPQTQYLKDSPERKQGSAGAYDNTQLLEKRRELMNWWTKELVTQGMEI